MERKIYMDAISSTYINNEVLQEMTPVLAETYANSTGFHSFAKQSKDLIDRAKRQVAKGIGSKSSEIYFTSSGTEANCWAILGLARANKEKGNHIIVSKIESESLLRACAQLEKEGFRVSYIPVDSFGFIKLSHLMHEIKKDTILVSISVANKEVGTIQNLNAIARTVKERDIIFHCDACHAIGNININVKDLNIDAMSMSSNKIYGPSGVGALYLKNGINIDSLIYPSNQDYSKRGGSQSVADIVGFGKAVDMACHDVTLNAQKLRHLREYFTKKVMENIEDVHLVGHSFQRLSNVVALSFEFVDSEALASLLDMEGIAVHPLNIALSEELEHSHILTAMGLQKELLKTVVNFSILKNLTKDDLDYVVEKLVVAVKKMREISPLHISVVAKEDK